MCPGSGEYAIGSPLFEKAIVHLENGEDLVINADGCGPYIESIKLNGKVHNSWFLNHDDLKDGADITFVTSSECK